jgi:transcriptional regulator with XRE-family HTH domain
MAEVSSIGPRRSRPLLRTLVGEVLRRRRREQARTLADVARAARVSVPYLSEVERGRKEASSEVLAAICDALAVDLAELLADMGRDLDTVHAPVLRFDPARRYAPAVPRRTVSPPVPRRPGDVVLLAA